MIDFKKKNKTFLQFAFFLTLFILLFPLFIETGIYDQFDLSKPDDAVIFAFIIWPGTFALMMALFGKRISWLIDEVCDLLRIGNEKV